uniref:Uncharacterized protein n=1 Tax=Panagrolaimus sp. ES5 TaxID=591445 RepID=A0AC34FZ79_9BILA
MNRNPEFRSKNELNKDAGTSGALGVPNYGSQRRHSLNITVGTEGPPDTFVRPRTYSVSGRDGVSSSSKSPNSSHKKEALKNRRFSAPCILKEPPTFQLSSRRNRKTSENAATETTEISSTPSESFDRPRKPIIKKQKSEDFPESDSSDDSNENDFRHRRMKQNSPRLGNSGFFKNGSFRGENIIEEEPENENGGTSPACINSNVTIITTRF